MRRTSWLLVTVTAGCLACEAPMADDYTVPSFQRTTDGVIAKKNLDDAIRRAERLGPAEAEVALRLERARYFGTFDDFDRVDVLSEATLSETPTDRARLARATVLSRFHRFAEAQALADTIEDQGQTDVVALHATLAAARGDRERARRILEERDYPRDRMHHLGTWAITAAAGGDYDLADDEYRASLSQHRDVSPFVPAGTFFAMGVMWSERAGFDVRGRLLYESAVERLPSFVTANVHLAEVEAANDLGAAIARLETIVDSTDDPEPSSRLSSWYAELGDAESANLHRERARLGYEALLDRYPEAFADHACEFYMGAGNDPARAIQLAEINLTERRTPRAYSLLIRAAELAGDTSLACATYAEAIEKHVGAYELAELGADCSTR